MKDISFGQAVSTCFKKSFTFKGRATRAEYWFFVLFQWIISIACCFGGLLVGFIFDLGAKFDILMSLFIVIPFLVMLIPSLAVAVRRLHDTGRSGFYLLLIILGIIPIVSLVIGIVFLVIMVQPSDQNNKYGPNPYLQEYMPNIEEIEL